MKKIKIIMMVLVPILIGMMNQYAEAQNNCPSNKVRMFMGLKGCGCNTCQKICVDPVDVPTYQANGWSLTGCSKFCCGGFFRNGEAIPGIETSLTEIYPNPASGTINISFTLASDGEVTLDVFDMTGRHVQNIAHDLYEEDANEITWDASQLNPGIYFLRMKAGSYSATKRISVIK